MEAEEHGRQVGRDEGGYDIDERVIIVRGQRIGSPQCMVPSLVIFCEE
jgi:hypothetical protein